MELKPCNGVAEFAQSKRLNRTFMELKLEINRYLAQTGQVLIEPLWN